MVKTGIQEATHGLWDTCHLPPEKLITADHILDGQ